MIILLLIIYSVLLYIHPAWHAYIIEKKGRYPNHAAHVLWAALTAGIVALMLLGPNRYVIYAVFLYGAVRWFAHDYFLIKHRNRYRRQLGRSILPNNYTGEPDKKDAWLGMLPRFKKYQYYYKSAVLALVLAGIILTEILLTILLIRL